MSYSKDFLPNGDVRDRQRILVRDSRVHPLGHVHAITKFHGFTVKM